MGKVVDPTVVELETATIISFVTATQSYTATLTPLPTFTRQPTTTDVCPTQPGSANTVANVQERIEALVPGARVVWYDDFICHDYSYGWWTPNTNPTSLITISDSILTIQAERIPDTAGALIRNSKDIYDNNGVLVLFRYEKGSSVNLLIDAGEWLESSYRGWGLAVNGDNYGNNFWIRWTGKYLTPTDFPVNILKPDSWYYLLIRLGKNGDVTMRVWNKNRQTQNTEFHLALGKDWVGKYWKAGFQVPGGKLDVDEYIQLIFM
jgi:hypothetical protein